MKTKKIKFDNLVDLTTGKNVEVPFDLDESKREMARQLGREIVDRLIHSGLMKSNTLH